MGVTCIVEGAVTGSEPDPGCERVLVLAPKKRWNTLSPVASVLGCVLRIETKLRAIDTPMIHINQGNSKSEQYKQRKKCFKK
jgi:hypothetical protein